MARGGAAGFYIVGITVSALQGERPFYPPFAFFCSVFTTSVGGTQDTHSVVGPMLGRNIQSTMGGLLFRVFCSTLYFLLYGTSGNIDNAILLRGAVQPSGSKYMYVVGFRAAVSGTAVSGTAVSSIRKLQRGTLYIVYVHEMTDVVLPSAGGERPTSICRFATVLPVVAPNEDTFSVTTSKSYQSTLSKA